MILKEKNYDISLSIEEFPQVELIKVKLNNSNDIRNDDSNKNNTEITSSTEFGENYDDEDSNILKEKFSNSLIDDKFLLEKNQDKKVIKYRKGNLYIIYNKNGEPKIVIGPDCKYFPIYLYEFFIVILIREIFHIFTNIIILYNNKFLFKILEIF